MSVSSNVPTYSEPICFVSEGDTSEKVESCLSYLTDISEKALRLLVPRYEMVFEEIQQRLNQNLEEYKDDEERDREEKKHHLYQLKQQLERYLQEFPVVGFNTGKYHVNAMKVDFFTRLVDSHKIKHTVKWNNNFMCIKTEKLKFLDNTNYMVPGFSNSQYLNAYKCTEQKGFFPYKWMTSLDKLNVSQLPPHEAFYSTLKNENISAEDYQLCLNVWQENDMKTTKEFLTWYNNKDVEPMLEAIDKMFQFNQNIRIDMFKDGISVPGLVLKYMFQDLPTTSLYRMRRIKMCTTCTSIVGGPIIVFHRYHEKDKTFIRPAEYTDPKPFQLIYGVDANALYLWSIMQKMPTGHFVRRKKEDGFKRQAPSRYEWMVIDWLEWEAKNTGQHIRHQSNDKEKVIGRRRLPVDGFYKETNTVYELQGCLWHGHRCWITKDKSVNPINGKSLDDLFKTTQEKIDEIKDQGYAVKQVWECAMGRLKKQDPELKAFITDRQRPCDGQFKMT
jgi:G:T-mismatch repair DNA endonuclease (very short patch repair protein)